MELRPPDPPLGDDRIVLRDWTDEDLPAIVAACRDSDTARWTTVPIPYTREDAREWLERRCSAASSQNREDTTGQLPNGRPKRQSAATRPWLSQFRRLRMRYDVQGDIHEAFLSLGWAPICWQSLRKLDDEGLSV